MTIALLFHILAAVIWVGGMFFAHVMLRPAAAALDPPVRLALFQRVLGNFFPWVWACVIVLLASAYGVLLPRFGGFAHAAAYINIMQVLGLIMVAVFLHLFFAPWKRFSRAVAASDWPAAGVQLTQIRRLVLFNLVLGLIVVVIGGTGRYWG